MKIKKKDCLDDSKYFRIYLLQALSPTHWNHAIPPQPQTFLLNRAVDGCQRWPWLCLFPPFISCSIPWNYPENLASANVSRWNQIPLIIHESLISPPQHKTSRREQRVMPPITGLNEKQNKNHMYWFFFKNPLGGVKVVDNSDTF